MKKSKRCKYKNSLTVDMSINNPLGCVCRHFLLQSSLGVNSVKQDLGLQFYLVVTVTLHFAHFNII